MQYKYPISLSRTNLFHPVVSNQRIISFAYTLESKTKINTLSLNTFELAVKCKEKGVSNEEGKEVKGHFKFWDMPADHGIWFAGNIGIRYRFDLRSFKLIVHEVFIRPAQWCMCT